MNRVLGIDHGEARIGLAVSDELGMLAHPLETIHLKERPETGKRNALRRGEQPHSAERKLHGGRHLKPETGKPSPDPLARIAAICERDRIACIILGLPRNMNGTYGPAAEKVRAFAEKLRAEVACDVKLWDERLTSVAAQRSLHEAGRTVKNSREIIDQVAAQMILQSWLDSQAMKT